MFHAGYGQHMLATASTLAQQSRIALVYQKAAEIGYDVQLTNNSNGAPTATPEL